MTPTTLSIGLCRAILGGADITQPVTHADVHRGHEIEAAISMPAQSHPTLGEALRRGAGYSWVL